jgi:hypothetical protein
MTTPSTTKRPRTWAKNLREWRRQSLIVGFLFVLAETAESALPMRMPLLSGILFCVLPGPYKLRNARLARKAAKQAKKEAAAKAQKAVA